jgi:hypothetical protein
MIVCIGEGFKFRLFLDFSAAALSWPHDIKKHGNFSFCLKNKMLMNLQGLVDWPVRS